MTMAPIPQLSLGEAWQMLQDKPDAVLIDVRTTAEWNFVGVPDLSALPNELRTVEWTTYPSGAVNARFVEQAAGGLSSDQPILLLCRSGARSQAGAEALQAQGFANVHNIAPGFEGPLDGDQHRHGGWKDELPWVQG